MHETQCKRGVKNVVVHIDGHDLPGRDGKPHGTVTHAVNESREPCVADNSESCSGGAHCRRRRIVPRLKEDGLDDIHSFSMKSSAKRADSRCR